MIRRVMGRLTSTTWIYLTSVIQRILHSEEIYQMSVYVTRNIKQMLINDKTFNTRIYTVDERICKVSSDLAVVVTAVQELTRLLTITDQTILTMHTTTNLMSTTITTLLGHVTNQKVFDPREVEDLLFNVKRETTHLSGTLHECERLSQRLKDELLDTLHRRVC
jgi:hypothetical protein